MDGDAYGDGYHEAFEPDGVEDIGAKEEREPQHGEDVCFDAAGYHPVLAEVTDVGTQLRMTHQPVVHTR